LEGQVTIAWQGDLLYGRQVTQSVVTPELPLVGVRLQQWPEIVAMCREAHRIFPGHALIGWDVAMCRNGPVLSEVNANPLHQSYQRSFQRGFMHKDHVDRLDAARSLMYSRTGTTAPKK
jgi:Sugar-transfer associated ATP-grasp